MRGSGCSSFSASFMSKALDLPSFDDFGQFGADELNHDGAKNLANGTKCGNCGKGECAEPDHLLQRFTGANNRTPQGK